MPEPTRILVLNSVFHLGGGERIIRDIFARIDRKRFDPVYCSLYEPGPIGEEIIAAGGEFHARLLRRRTDLVGGLRLLALARRLRVGAVFLQANALTLAWGTVLSRALSVPAIAAVHSTLDLATAGRTDPYRIFLPRMSRVITVGELQKDRVVEGAGVAAQRVVVVPNGLDLSQWAPGADGSAVRRELGIAPDQAVIGIVARLIGYKGLDVFLEAARDIVSRRGGVQFLVVGDGPDAPAIRAMSSALGLERHVTFLGARHDVARLVGAMDVGVLSSRTEALPMAILEYMACAKPVVSTDVGSVRDLIDEGRTGYVVPSGDSTALAQRLCQLLDNPAAARAMGGAGRLEVEKRFTLENTVRRTSDVIAAALAHPG